MVCAMPKTRQGTPDDRARLDTALGWAREAAARLRSLVDEDAQAYDGVVAAYRLPKASEDEKEARRLAVAKAMARATEVPLETAESCLVVIRAAGVALAHGNPNAESDARTASALAIAGLRGAAENVKTNAAGRAELLELQQRVLAVLAEGEAAGRARD
jgi:formiminotetrahydrofolate cyclodeaminase